MKHLLTSIKILLFFTIVLGFAYPIVMTKISQLLFPNNSNGAILSRDGQIIGSKLIGQNFEKPEYFWSRPSAISYNPLPSGGSNQGQSSKSLKQSYDERRAKILSTNPGAGEPPQDLLFASASGLDPHISPKAAIFQINRVARARSMSINEVEKLVKEYAKGRQWGIFGEPTVNVLSLNIALDKMQGIDGAPTLTP